MQLIVKGGTCVNPNGSFQADLAIDDGIIRLIGQGLSLPAERTLDAQGKLVLPGAIDVHCHMPWISKGVSSGDDFSSGTQAAARGGVTTIVPYIVPEEGETLEQSLEQNLRRACGHSYVDYSLQVTIRDISPAILAEMGALVRNGFPSFKIYTAYPGLLLEDRAILDLFEQSAREQSLICIHAESEVIAHFHTQRLLGSGKRGVYYYPDSRPPICEVEAIARLLTYAKHLKANIHFCHVSTAQGAALIGLTRAEGARVSGETCPQYLLFTDEEYRRDDPEATYFVASPPLRPTDDQDALWRSIANDALSIVATDHCPYTSEEKKAGRSDFTMIPGGMAGIETRLPLMYTEGVGRGRLSLNRLVELCCTNPARRFGLYPRKGVIAPGSDGDLVLIDPQQRTRLTAAALHSNTDHSVYEGMIVEGFPYTTVLRGQVLVEEGTLVTTEPQGKLVFRSLGPGCL
ncbi:MAG: dihydropyrimidinase [Chloroflexi bacterium]|nr:dihydropyrimidinase [Chloroflexota bacterium]MCL5074878.1 dihydropyrimidinase [Chloroflexota bacterium]